MAKIVLPLLILLTGCMTFVSDANPADSAKPYIGLDEKKDRVELQQLLGVDPVKTEWCAAFVNAILSINETPNLYDLNHAYPLTARAFLDWGTPIYATDIRYGDLVIFPRGNQGWQGHVGFYVGRYPPTGEWIILGGNQDNTVSYALYKSSKALGIRRWPE